MTVSSMLDSAERRRSPATLPGFHAGRAPRNKGMRYPADPPTVEEIVCVMRHAGENLHGFRLRAMIVMLWHSGGLLLVLGADDAPPAAGPAVHLDGLRRAVRDADGPFAATRRTRLRHLYSPPPPATAVPQVTASLLDVLEPGWLEPPVQRSAS